MVDQVQVIANASGGGYFASRNNSAQQLADALSNFAPDAQSAIRGVGAQLKQRAEQRARADVEATGAQEFAEAVRAGRLESTQNPWYMAAYRRESAAVRSRAALGQLAADAQQWEERGDPQAFAQRWATESATIGEQFSGDTDSQAAYQAVSAEVRQQQMAAATGEAVERIQQERAANLATLAAEAIATVNRENAGNASPEQITQALSAVRLQVLGTGGTQQEFDQIVYRAVTSTAYNQLDSDIFDYLQADRGDQGGVIANLPDVADRANVDRYYVEQRIERERTRAMEARRTEIQTRGTEAADALYAQFGTRILMAQVPLTEMVQQLEEAGFDAPAIQYALGQIQSGISDSVSISRAVMNRDMDVLNLLTTARTTGAVNRAQVERMVIEGRLEVDDAARILDTAQDRREASSGSGGGGRDADRVRTVSELRTRLTDIGEITAGQVSRIRGAVLESSDRTAYINAVSDAGLLALESDPDNLQAALAAARRRAAEIITAASTPQQQTQQRPATQASNPRR